MAARVHLCSEELLPRDPLQMARGGKSFFPTTNLCSTVRAQKASIISPYYYRIWSKHQLKLVLVSSTEPVITVDDPNSAAHVSVGKEGLSGKGGVSRLVI